MVKRAAFASECPVCLEEIEVDDPISTVDGQWAHESCVEDVLW